MKLFIRGLLDTVFPPICHCCKTGIPDAGDLHICRGCMDKVQPVLSPLCICCGSPFATEGGEDHLCGTCSISHPPFAGSRSAVHFSGAIREMIHRFKYGKQVHLARPLALLAASVLTPFLHENMVDLMLPVPLHDRRLRERGFNQAVLLGEVLSRIWNLPLRRDSLRRIRWTEPQINLKADDRAHNVKGAFALSDPAHVRGRRVILIDDVYTTGSTMRECAKTLVGAGSASVYAVTVARAVD